MQAVKAPHINEGERASSRGMCMRVEQTAPYRSIQRMHVTKHTASEQELQVLQLAWQDGREIKWKGEQQAVDMCTVALC
eukprot:1155695-Pelagomonas_calceolata.AAC.1